MNHKGEYDMNYICLIEDTLDYIEENLEINFTLDILSKRFCVLKCDFNRIFSTVMGDSLFKYIRSRRLNRAVMYIKETDYNVSDISYRLQFSSEASFTQLFKTTYGISPIELRKNKDKIRFELYVTYVNSFLDHCIVYGYTCWKIKLKAI